MAKLGIIIPAYKAKFFSEALESIASQTNKNFHLYIGDDNSPENLESIIDGFKDRITLTYVRFAENLGGKELVAQWERCIALSKEEEWIWLFSDDDILAPNCVEEFYQNLNSSAISDLYHFDVSVIDMEGREIERDTPFPNRLTSLEFLLGKFTSKYRSYVVEYVFSRKRYEELKGFPKFDLAWNTDDAMWFQMAQNSSINTVPNAKVYWRASGVNISRIKDNKEIAERKLKSDISYLKWLRTKFADIAKIDEKRIRKIVIYWFYSRLYNSRKIIEKSERERLSYYFQREVYQVKNMFFIKWQVWIKQSKIYKTIFNLLRY
ncbi:glycosyltransferase [uncultured Draconibacterium sp.]|uniref:glycosyltransferase family 2 protein n=1 Tax=uncultured Draconibacterium sp. TaxID=1573823 RepID=UPI00321704EF